VTWAGDAFARSSPGVPTAFTRPCDGSCGTLPKEGSGLKEPTDVKERARNA